MLEKIIWMLRALFLKPFFGEFGLLSYLGKPLFLSNVKRIFIGKRVRIYPGARIEVVTKNGKIQLGEDISIGQNIHLISDGNLIIGSKTTISGNVFITNVDHSYQDIGRHIMKQSLIVKDTFIGENCFLGYGVVIQAGTILGEHCVVGSNSVVKGEFPDYSVIVGAPARIVKRYNSETNKWQKTNKFGDFI
ncbi:MAG: acyltransferase [Marinifilaceae bacterium]|nr:acyltransferase [Marinifilaceae bacterium]